MTLPRLVDLPAIRDARGALGVAQEGEHVPFPIRRLFYLYDLAPGTNRGEHAHREQHQFVIMLAGSCRLRTSDGHGWQEWTLDSPAAGLHVPPLIWLEMQDFAPGSVCAVLTSDAYDEADYVRDHAEFTRLTAATE